VEENLAILCSSGLDLRVFVFGACTLPPIPMASVFWPHPINMAVSWVSSASGLQVCGTWMLGESVTVGEYSIKSGGDKAGSATMPDSWAGW